MAGLTVTVADPLRPSLVAVMVTVPMPTPATRPLPLTVASEVLLLPQLIARPESGLPAASSGVAVSCTVLASVTDVLPGVTDTEATGTPVTATEDVPLCPSLVAVMVTVPLVSPVTSPLPSTAATEVLLLLHVTDLPLSGFPLASSGVAVSCVVCPACTEAVAGETATLATASGWLPAWFARAR